MIVSLRNCEALSSVFSIHAGEYYFEVIVIFLSKKWRFPN